MLTSTPRHRVTRPHTGAATTGAFAATLASLFSSAIAMEIIRCSCMGMF
ncbi:MAG: hypothetical protein AAGE98_18645 [Actinomycetota bacterium]